MNILICDYDNTILLHKDIKQTFKKIKLMKNKKSLSEIRKNGDKLMISTGRFYSGIKSELEKQKISYDYLSCNYGADLYDKNDKLLYSIALTKSDVSIIKSKDYENISIYTALNNDIVSINIIINDENIYKREYKYLNDNLKESSIECKFPKIKIVNKRANKVKSADFIINKNNFNKIYSIGDSICDYELLKKYNGYTLPWSELKIRKISSVSKLVKVIENEKNMPSGLCVGFAKCGTTTLYDIFSQNDNIYLSKIKEPVFFGYNKLYVKGFDWYLKRYYPIKTSKKIVEINPRIAKYASAKEIYDMYGKIKIIFIIRNPVKRLYSNFKMNLNTGKCFEATEKHLSNNTSKLFDEWIKENFYINSDNVEFFENVNTNKMLNGKYYDVIKDYYNIFGKENVYVCIFEDFINDKEKYSKEMFDFFNIKVSNNINYDVHVNKGDRIPRSKLSIKITSFLINCFWKDFVLGKLPFVSNSFSKINNGIIWKCPIIFSKKNNQDEQISEYATKILSLYYYDMIVKLSKLLSVDLFKKWNINNNREELWKS